MLCFHLYFEKNPSCHYILFWIFITDFLWFSRAFCNYFLFWKFLTLYFYPTFFLHGCSFYEKLLRCEQKEEIIISLILLQYVNNSEFCCFAFSLSRFKKQQLNSGFKVLVLPLSTFSALLLLSHVVYININAEIQQPNISTLELECVNFNLEATHFVTE